MGSEKRHSTEPAGPDEGVEGQDRGLGVWERGGDVPKQGSCSGVGTSGHQAPVITFAGL